MSSLKYSDKAFLNYSFPRRRLSNHFDLSPELSSKHKFLDYSAAFFHLYNRRTSTRNFSIRANYNEKKEEEEEEKKVSVRNLSFHSSRYSCFFALFIRHLSVSHTVSPSPV